MRIGAIALTLLVAIGGCAVPEPTEGRGSTTSKLLAPRATVHTPASKETKAKLGIASWKIFRSRNALHMTGYV